MNGMMDANVEYGNNTNMMANPVRNNPPPRIQQSQVEPDEFEDDNIGEDLLSM